MLVRASFERVVPLLSFDVSSLLHKNCTVQTKLDSAELCVDIISNPVLSCLRIISGFIGFGDRSIFL